MVEAICTVYHAVHGSETLRSPVEVGSLSRYLQGFYIPGGAGFLNHQQYHVKLGYE